MLILDANVVIRTRGRLSNDRLVTIPEVVEELQSNRSMNNFEANEIDVLRCREEFYRKVKELSSNINSNTSVADEKIVGLGLQTDGKVVTDDREVQNLCLHLGVKFKGFLDDPIKEKRSWVLVCSNCGSKGDGQYLFSVR